MFRTSLPFLLLVLIAFTSCENQPITKEACDCERYYLTSRDADHPLIEFRNAYRGTDLGMFFNDIFLDSLLFEDSLENYSREEFLAEFQFNINDNSQFQNSPILGFAKASDTSIIMKVLDAGQHKHWFEVHPIRFVWSQETVTIANQEMHKLYGLNTNISERHNVSLDDVSSARISQDPNDKSYGVSISMTNEGAEKWAQYTRENVGNFIAIMSYDQVLSAPVINGPITGGEVLISGAFSKPQASELVKQFNCSALINSNGIKQFEQDLKDCK